MSLFLEGYVVGDEHTHHIYSSLLTNLLLDYRFQFMSYTMVVIGGKQTIILC